MLYVLPKRRLTFEEVHSVISQKTEVPVIGRDRACSDI
jgi:hypothetical protein